MMRPAASPEINRSEAGPVTADEYFRQGEDVLQEAASFDFDYLAKAGKGGGGSCKLRRESLFVKFDPLVGLPDNPSIKTMSDDSTEIEEKEKMASETGGATPKKMLDGSDQPVQKLISITPSKNETLTKTRSTINSPATPRQDMLSREISKLQEILMQQEQSYQEQLISKTDEVEDLRKRIEELETREPREDLEEKLKASEVKASKLKKELAENALGKKQLTMIMEEYEKTISQLVTKREDEKKEFETVKETIAGERDMALQHLSNMEVAFNDIHQKYEKAKIVIESMKINEQLLKESLAENEKTIKKQEGDYQKLKKHASEKLESANKELMSLRKAHQAEVATVKAIAKKSEIKVKSLEESLEQKNKEIRELTQICDELIEKVEHQYGEPLQ